MSGESTSDVEIGAEQVFENVTTVLSQFTCFLNARQHKQSSMREECMHLTRQYIQPSDEHHFIVQGNRREILITRADIIVSICLYIIITNFDSPQVDWENITKIQTAERSELVRIVPMIFMFCYILLDKNDAESMKKITKLYQLLSPHAKKIRQKCIDNDNYYTCMDRCLLCLMALRDNDNHWLKSAEMCQIMIATLFIFLDCKKVLDASFLTQLGAIMLILLMYTNISVKEIDLQTIDRSFECRYEMFRLLADNCNINLVETNELNAVSFGRIIVNLEKHFQSIKDKFFVVRGTDYKELATVSFNFDHELYILHLLIHFDV